MMNRFIVCLVCTLFSLSFKPTGSAQDVIVKGEEKPLEETDVPRGIDNIVEDWRASRNRRALETIAEHGVMSKALTEPITHPEKKAMRMAAVVETMNVALV
jgi:hypothetical protein